MKQLSFRVIQRIFKFFKSDFKAALPIKNHGALDIQHGDIMTRLLRLSDADLLTALLRCSYRSEQRSSSPLHLPHIHTHTHHHHCHFTSNQTTTWTNCRESKRKKNKKRSICLNGVSFLPSFDCIMSRIIITTYSSLKASSFFTSRWSCAVISFASPWTDLTHLVSSHLDTGVMADFRTVGSFKPECLVSL